VKLYWTLWATGIVLGLIGLDGLGLLFLGACLGQLVLMVAAECLEINRVCKDEEEVDCE
jgi:hypothetical protein